MIVVLCKWLIPIIISPKFEITRTLWFLSSIGKTKWPLAAILYKNAQKACGISNCVINSSINFIFGIAIDNTGGHFEKKFKKKKLRIDLKWRQMHSKVIFGHPKWPPTAILWFKKKIKVAYWSKMARNVMERDFRSSKMAAGSHFVEKKSKLRIDLKWWEMQSKVIFGHPKWLLAAIL